MNPIVVAVGRSASHNFSNNRWAIFLGPDDDARYRDWLAEAAGSSGYAIHACVLMTNHVHLLLTPLAADSLPRNMQSLGRAPCATSTRPIDEPAPSGRDVTAPHRSTRRLISSPAAAISSSIRCAPARSHRHKVYSRPRASGDPGPQEVAIAPRPVRILPTR